MQRRSELVAHLLDSRLIAILRVADGALVGPVCRTLVESGFQAIELTWTIPEVASHLIQVRQELGKKALFGVGSLLNQTMMETALQAGADFVVTPITRPKLISTAHDFDRPILM